MSSEETIDYIAAPLPATRNAWQIFCSVQTALIIRNVQKRFITNVNSKRSLAFLWIFLEPMMHIAVWMLIRGVQGIGIGAGSLPLPLFILLGAIPWLLTTKIISGSTNAISANKGLLMFRQIRPIDFIFAIVISEIGVITLVFMFILGLFWWLGIAWQIHDTCRWMFALISYFCFLLGMSTLVMVLAFFFKFVSKLMTVVMRAMYFLSGIFFSINTVPVNVRNYLMCNPLFQVVQITREAFDVQIQHHVFSDPLYLFKAGIVTLTVGMGAYLLMRQKIMVEIQQR